MRSSGGSGGGEQPTEGVPAFLAKLWKLVDEPRTDHLISWAHAGNAFVIRDQIDFARKLLPLYYKHNNMASFVRQLNMYGFHKVVTVDTGSLKCDNEEIRFSHACFLRGHAYLLKHIKRKIATSKAAAAAAAAAADERALLKPETMTKVLTDVKQMKGRQESLDARFSVMKHENEALWREVALLRQKHIKQQQIVNNLIQFLMSIVQNSRNGPLKTGVKRQYRLMINDAAHEAADDAKSARLEREELDDEELVAAPDFEGPIIHEVGGDFEPAHRHIKSELTASPGDAATPSPAPSTVAESLEDLDDALAHSLSLDTLFDVSNVDDPMRAASSLSERVASPAVALSEDVASPSSSTTGRSKAAFRPQRQQVASPTFTLASQEPTALPMNIFDSDEANSQDEAAEAIILEAEAEEEEAERRGTLHSTLDQDLEAACEPGDAEIIDSLNLLPVATATLPPPTSVKGKSAAKKRSKADEEEEEAGELVDSLASGNSKYKGKSKASNGKSKELVFRNSEVPDLLEDNDVTMTSSMTLATLPQEKTKRPVLHRFNSVEDVDDHLSSMQSDIENLRDLLSGDYTLDANTLLGLFGQEDPLYGLSMPNSDIFDKVKDPEDESNQLISYVPPVSTLGFDDFDLDDGVAEQAAKEVALPPEKTDTTLNTPQVQLSEPKFQ